MVEENAQTSPPGEYVSVRDLSVYYEASGDSSGEPLVLLHGGTLSSQMWAAQVPFLALHFRVITPDNRGHGRTNNPSLPSHGRRPRWFHRRARFEPTIDLRIQRWGPDRA